MVLLPVFWLGLYGTRRQLWCMLAGIGVIVFLPLVLDASYPASAWRAGILLLAVSGIIGATIQLLVVYARQQASERNELLGRLETLAHTATWDRAEAADRLMIRADEALYEAKRARSTAASRLVQEVS